MKQNGYGIGMFMMAFLFQCVGFSTGQSADLIWGVPNNWTVATNPEGLDNAAMDFNDTAVLCNPADFDILWTFVTQADADSWLITPFPFLQNGILDPAPLVESVAMNQSILLPADAAEIRFDVSFETYDRAVFMTGETDTFSAVFTVTDSQQEILNFSFSSADVNNLLPGTEGLLLDHSFVVTEPGDNGEETQFQIKHRVYSRTIQVPVAEWAGNWVDLRLAVANDYDDTVRTVVTVNNLVIVTEETAAYSGVALTVDSPFAVGPDGTASVPMDAQLVDEQGIHVGVGGVDVTFDVTSQVPNWQWPETTRTTDSTGFVEVEGSFPPGVYTATATISTPQGPRTDTTIFVVYNPVERGFVTGGGWIISNPLVNPQRANFGFEAKYKNGVPTGHLEFRFTDGSIDLKSESIDYLVVAAPYAWLAGWARAAHGGDGYWFFVTLQDRSKSGSGDSLNIDLWEPGADLLGNPSFSAGNALDGGNIVIHSK